LGYHVKFLKGISEIWHIYIY